MNEAQVYADVLARLRSDSGVHGLFPASGVGQSPKSPTLTGIFNDTFNPGQVMPFLAITMFWSEHDDAFPADVVDVSFIIALHSSKTPPALEKSQYIIERVYGDALRQSSRQPTYGLHRWTPGTSVWNPRDPSDLWRYGVFKRGAPSQEHIKDRYVFVERYSVRMYKSQTTTAIAGNSLLLESGDHLLLETGDLLLLEA